jgi:enoyl-CoA hydratase
MREATKEPPTVSTRADGRVTVVAIERPERRNAVDFATARALFDVFKRFDADPNADVAVLAGADGAFCAGFDLKALAGSEPNLIDPDGEFGPMGPTRLKLTKPVIAAIEGPAVAGGMELALWCDLRIAARSAILGIFNRRFGVPLVDLGTIRLPRIIGHGRALELITLCGFPQTAMRNDRLSAIEQWDLDLTEAIANEVALGVKTIEGGETRQGLARFASGAGRHGRFDPEGE